MRLTEADPVVRLRQTELEETGPGAESRDSHNLASSITSIATAGPA